MAKIVLTNANVSLAGTDISSYVKQVTLTTSAAEVETTAFGNTAKTRVAGLLDNKVQLDIQQDYSAVEGLVYPLVGGTAVTLVVRPNGTGTASTRAQSRAGSKWPNPRLAAGKCRKLPQRIVLSPGSTRSRRFCL